MPRLNSLERLTRFCILIPFCALSISCSSGTKEVEIPVLNGDFETGNLAPWVPFQAVQAGIATNPVHSGKFSLSEVSGDGSVYQDVKGLQPEVSYIASGWVSGSPDAT